jgi:hypothetical protein
MCLGSSPKWLEWPHPELVHWWLLVQSSLSTLHYNDFTLVAMEQATLVGLETRVLISFMCEIEIEIILIYFLKQ